MIYAAKSTEDKRGSIQTQLEDCRLMAEREGWEIIGEFSDEGFSAYHGNRGPGLIQAKQLAMRAAAEHGRCILSAQDADRFARGAGDAPGAADHLGEVYFAMKRQKVELWTVRSRQLDLLRAALEGERAHDETARKAQAVAAGIKRQRAKGKPWGEAPIGYRIEKRVVDNEVVAIRVVDPHGQQIVLMIFDVLDKGASTGAVARKLNQSGYKSRRGKQFKARTVRAIAENPEYMGTTAYPLIIEADLWHRVNEKIKRADRAATQNRKGGRAPLADFMLRRLAFCAMCGEPMYSVVRHGKRIYVCAAQLQRRGTCASAKVPAHLAEERILEHLMVFVGRDLGGWIGDRLAERSDALTAHQSALDAEKAKLAALDRQRDQLYAQYERLVAEDDPLARYALEPVAKLDQKRERQGRSIAEAEALLEEWTSEVHADGVLDFYESVVAFVEGRIASANSVAEINAALHDSLTGVWLSFNGETLTAEVRLRPTGDEDLDMVMAEMFGGTLAPEPEMIEGQRCLLRDTAPRCS